MRCFIAIELDDALRQPLVDLLRDELPRTRDVRWCNEGQLHITLKFLGDVPDDRLPGVCDAVRAAAAQVAPFQIALALLGCFPDARNARVLWCGVEDPAGGCARWVEIADPLLANLGFHAESRRFTPHVTLGRSKSSAGSRLMRGVLDSVRVPGASEMLVERVTVFQSTLSPHGAKHSPLFSAELSG